MKFIKHNIYKLPVFICLIIIPLIQANGQLPTATLSDNSTICSGTTTTLGINITSANPPATFIYQKDEEPPVTIENVWIFNGVHYLTGLDSGNYRLYSIKDGNGDGIVTTTGGIVSNYPKPSATILSKSDTLKLCSGDQGSISIELGGKSPWGFTYLYNGSEAGTKSDIMSSPYELLVNSSPAGTYTISTVTDGNGCTGTGTGYIVVQTKSDPTAKMKNDTVWACKNALASVSVNFTGVSPWKLYYTVNSGSEVEISNITKASYTIKNSATGVYKVTRVYDAANNEGCVSGTSTVFNYPVPTANFTGDVNKSICEGASTTFNVALTGTSPWSFNYRYQSNVADTIKGVSSSPYGLNVNKDDTYTLIYVHDKYCPGTASGTATLDLKKAPNVSISGIESMYSVSTVSDPIEFSPSGGSYAASDKPAAIQPYLGVLSFWPVIASIGATTIRYQYTNTDGCTGKASVETVVISDQGLIKIVDNRLDTLPKLCYNIDSVMIVGYKIGDLGYGSFTISGSSDAISDLGNDTAYIFPKKIKTGERTVTYSYTVGTTPKSVTRVFKFETLKADFEWDNECFGNDGKAMITFTDKSTFETNSTAVHNYWNIADVEYDNTGVEVELDQLDTFLIEHRVVTNYGCDVTVKKNLILRPTYNPHSIAYFEDFSEGPAYWSSQPIIKDSLNTWTLGRPLGQIFDAASGSKAWYTNVLDNKKAESSYVISPCFDFSTMNKPMIKMKIWRGFISNIDFDGATLQYTTDNGKNWLTIGGTEDGINWYNSYRIQTYPGNQQLGWTGKQDANWVECRNSLDNAVSNSKVRFRIAYSASNYNYERDGIAFDDIWIGERNRKVLIEHFTNASSEKCVEPNANLNLLANKNAIDVIDLQYHMNYPGVDTFYNYNSIPSSSRELYYSISGVPYTLINGGSNDDYNKELEENHLTIPSLEDSKFNLKLDAIYRDDYAPGDVIPITVDIQAQTAISNRTITLYVVLTENEIKGITGANGETVFESVVRDMIPDYAENTFKRGWAAGEKQTREFEWTIMEGINVKALRVVAFIQDETTQEIYQATIDNPNVFSSIKENIIKSGRSFLVYPNPASGNATIQWSGPLMQNCVIEINDFLGRAVWRGIMNAGEIESTIPLDRVNSGTYIVRSIGNNVPVETQKLIVIE